MQNRLLKLGAALGLVAVLGAACGSNSDDNKSATPTTEHHMAEGTESGASALRAGLTGLLQEHVYLAGIATGEALAGRDLAAPAAALDKNSVGLSTAISSVYGDAAGKQFLDLWRKHIGFFVDYTKGVAAKNTAATTKAKADLDGYRADFGAFIASANPNLPKDAVAAELVPHIQTLLAAIDAQAAKSPTAFDKLKAAADHMPMTADILAGGIVKQFPEKFAGDEAGGAAKLRAGLTGLLQAHVYLAGIATGTALHGGDLAAPAATLDKNSVELADAIGSVYGDAAGKQFLDLWRKHIGFFVDYTKGKATKNQAMVDKAKADLDGYRADFGAFLASANPNLTKQAVADELTPHVQTLFDAIDAQAAGNADAFDKLETAAGHMPMTASILAGAIAKQFPDKFPG